MKNTFGKSEKLKKKKYFDTLFEKGKGITVYPIRMIFIPFNELYFTGSEKLPKKTQVAFSAPKKRFKNAVDRNRIKRQMREAYRLNKSLLTKPHAILWVYLPKEKLDYSDIEKAIQKGLKKIN